MHSALSLLPRSKRPLALDVYVLGGMALALLDARHKYMAKVIATSFGMAAPSVEEVLASEENLQAAEDFFRADGAPKHCKCNSHRGNALGRLID